MKSITIRLLCFALIPFLSACVQMKQDELRNKQSEPTTEEQPAAPAPTHDPDDKIEIVIHHPGANQKNIYYRYWQFNYSKVDAEEKVIPQEVLQQIRDYEAVIQYLRKKRNTIYAVKRWVVNTPTDEEVREVVNGLLGRDEIAPINHRIFPATWDKSFSPNLQRTGIFPATWDKYPPDFWDPFDRQQAEAYNRNAFAHLFAGDSAITFHIWEGDTMYSLTTIDRSLEHYLPRFADAEDAPVDNEKLGALLESATEGLIESDAFYSCRSVENGRQIRIRWTKKDPDNTKHKYEITTSSNCLDFAPFNVVIDGKRFLQINGEIGRQLQEFLNDDASFLAQKKHLKPGFIDFTKPLPQLESSETCDKDTCGSLVLNHFDAIFKADPHLKAMLDVRNADETNDQWKTTLELGCNQSKSPTCDALVGRYTIPLSAETRYYLSFTYENQTLKADFPTDFSAIRRGFEQPVLRAFIENTNQPVSVSWASPADCPVLNALAPWFEDKGNTKNTNHEMKDSCDAWTFTSADKAQSIIYYPRLDATWVADDPETLKNAVKPLASKKYLPKATKKFISNCDKPASVPRNLFLDGQSNIYLFETKDGKTTCTTCL